MQLRDAGVNVDFLITQHKIALFDILLPNGNYMEHSQQAPSSYSKLCLIL